MHFFYPQRLRPLFLLAGLLLLSASQPLFAQAPTWQGAVSPGAGAGLSTAVDAAGNIYVTGFFSGTATFGATTLTSAGGDDVFVAKRTPAGVWQWATSGGGSGDDNGAGVAVDGSGNVVVTGGFSGTATFGATTLTTLTNVGSFGEGLLVAKLTPAGAWQWATTGAVGSRVDTGNGVAVDGSGNVVVTGSFFGTATFGATTLTSVGGADLFVAKLTPAGAWQWATRAEGLGNDIGTGVAVDGSGSVVVTGNFYSSPLSFGATTLTSAGFDDGFVAKLTPTGVWQWATSVRGNGFDGGTGVAVDGSGNVVVTGSFTSSTISFGATTLTNTGGAVDDVFVAKLTPTGSWQWATSARGRGTDISTGVAVDGSGSVLVTGTFGGLTISFGATMLTSVGSYDLFVAKLTPMGAWQWATSAGGPSYDTGFGVAVDGSGSVVVAGDFTSRTISFGATTLTNPDLTLPPYTAAALFLARLNTLTGLPEDPSQPAFTLAPNPARTTVQVTGATGTTATLLDALGRVVGTAAISPAGTATLAVGTLPTGLYLVRVGTSKAQRLVVE